MSRKKENPQVIAGPKPSVRETVTHRRNKAAGFAALNAAVTAASATGTAVFGVLPWLLLPMAVTQAVALLLNGGMAIRAQLALNLYYANPAAAYIVEVRNAFGLQGRN